MDLLLKNGDLVFDNGDIVLATGKQYVVQTILKELLIKVGSDPLEPDRGLDYNIGNVSILKDEVIKREVEKVIQNYIERQNINNDVIISKYKVFVNNIDNRTFSIKIILIDTNNNQISFSYNI